MGGGWSRDRCGWSPIGSTPAVPYPEGLSDTGYPGTTFIFDRNSIFASPKIVKLSRKRISAEIDRRRIRAQKAEAPASASNAPGAVIGRVSWAGQPMGIFVAHCACEIHIAFPLKMPPACQRLPGRAPPRGRGAGRRAARPAGVESPTAGLRETEDRDAETRPPADQDSRGDAPLIPRAVALGGKGGVLWVLSTL